MQSHACSTLSSTFLGTSAYLRACRKSSYKHMWTVAHALQSGVAHCKNKLWLFSAAAAFRSELVFSRICRCISTSGLGGLWRCCSRVHLVGMHQSQHAGFHRLSFQGGRPQCPGLQQGSVALPAAAAAPFVKFCRLHVSSFHYGTLLRCPVALLLLLLLLKALLAR